MIPLYLGFDAREEVGFHTFTSSVMHHSTEAVAFIPVSGPQRDGTNAFTYARFMVPALQRYEGYALFADGSDMIVKDDIAELWALRDRSYAVQVVQHDYVTRHPRKYVGTRMEADNHDYPRKNWASLMLFNCEHPAWKELPTLLEAPGPRLMRLEFLKDREIGALPRVWNWLADEYGENPHAKLLHYTAGIPAWKAYADTPHADDWRAANKRVNHATP